jgi:3-hydroxyacyl-CoA dehydrogenase/enoyl-CoA hydratase/3-hydroxybutyryl-CoA epimerase
MSYSQLTFTQLDPLSPKNIALVSFDVSDSKVNVFSEQMLVELKDVVERVTKDTGMKGIIFSSAKSDNFIAGADIKTIKALQNDTPSKAFLASQIGKEIFDKIAALNIPTVAIVHGKCLGGGTEFILACRYRLASNSPATAIALPEVKLGFVPGWGATVRLPRLVGLQSALSLILKGGEVDGKKAWRLNLVDECVDQDRLVERAKEIILGDQVRRHKQTFGEQVQNYLLENTPIGRDLIYKQAYKGVMRETRGKYPAPIEALKLVMKNVSRPINKAYEAESNAFAQLATSDVSRNLVNIWFAQTESKKAPAHSGAVPEIKTVGVLGAGVMGAGIAQAAAYAGYKVVLRDVEQKFVDGGMKKISRLFENLVSRHKISEEQKQKMLGSITGTIKYEDMQDCDLVIEAVLEDMKVKTEVLTSCEHTSKKQLIFATNTSSLSVNELAKGSGHPERVVGIHFFNPVHKMPLVEIVKGEHTSPETLAAAQGFALKLGKTTVVTADAPGFVVNRILTPYLREALILLEQGVDPELIERAATSFGMPMGPFTLLDEIGLDIGAKVMHVLHEAFGERLSPPAMLSQLADSKLLGKKGGEGFYLYDEDGKRKEFNAGVLAVVKAAPNKKYIGEIQDRLFLIMLNEATRCLEENVITEPSQLDLALIYGIGFPPYRGGILRYADTLGMKIVHQKLAFLSVVAGENYAPTNIILEKVANNSSFYSS